MPTPIQRQPQRQSPPTDRVIRVLDFLATGPQVRYTVSELARQTGLAKPTCIGIVRALARAGYLDHDEGRHTYGLGSALVALGRVAQERLPSLGVARPAMGHLSDELGLACTASAVTDDHLTIVERTGPPSALDPLIRVGQRLPLRPPTGKLAFIWRSDDRLDRWLAAWDGDAPAIDQVRFRRLVDQCRRRGYLVERLGEANRRLTTLLGTLPAHSLTHEVVAIVAQVAAGFGEADLLPFEPKPGRRYPVSTVSAPVYDHGGDLALVLILHVAAEGVATADVHRYGRALAAAAGEVTAGISGRDPWRARR